MIELRITASTYDTCLLNEYHEICIWLSEKTSQILKRRINAPLSVDYCFLMFCEQRYAEQALNVFNFQWISIQVLVLSWPEFIPFTWFSNSMWSMLLEFDLLRTFIFQNKYYIGSQEYELHCVQCRWYSAQVDMLGVLGKPA